MKSFCDVMFFSCKKYSGLDSIKKFTNALKPFEVGNLQAELYG